MQNSSSFQKIINDLGSFIKTKLIVFLKQSLLVPFIFATLLYILMRIFFIGAEFEPWESTELYVKTFLVTWSYINAWKLLCLGIIWIEKRTTAAKVAKLIDMPMLKKTAILIIVAGLTYTVKAGSLDKVNKKASQDSASVKEKDIEIDPKFYLWMK